MQWFIPLILGALLIGGGISTSQRDTETPDHYGTYQCTDTCEYSE